MQKEYQIREIQVEICKLKVATAERTRYEHKNKATRWDPMGLYQSNKTRLLKKIEWYVREMIINILH